MKLEGIIPPLITPMKTDESLDRTSLERLLEYVIDGGVSGVFLLGSCGEGPTIPHDIREELVGAVSQQCKGRIPVLVGVSEVGTRQTVTLARRLTRQGGDAIVVVPPYYFAHTQDEIASHVIAVAQSVDVPTFAYNIPQMVKTAIEPETVARLAALPEIAGIKDSLGNMALFQELLSIHQQRPGFLIYQGAEPVAALSIVRGAQGGVLGLANIAPRLCCDMYSAVRSGDLTQAWDLQEKIVSLGRLHIHGQWLPCLKMAASLLGLCGPTAGAPFAPLDEAATQAVQSDLRITGML